MKIFFAGSIRGGRAYQPEYEDIVGLLSAYGKVHAPHVPDGSLSPFGETNLSDEDIYTREIGALVACDVLIAETTTPSLGVGYLVARATELNKKIIVLHSGTNTLKLSAMITGNPHVAVYNYSSMPEAQQIFEEVLT